MTTSSITISVAWAHDGAVRDVVLVVPLGTTIAALLGSPEFRQLVPEHVVVSAAAIGVWSKVKPSVYVLRDRDRLEFYAALKADPKEQRRQRAR
jgi:putative ubiquitin-RnfH superfamily antitoxin RatB of RatAB toxin-antitoxin module